jgi:hypothetical protein
MICNNYQVVGELLRKPMCLSGVTTSGAHDCVFFELPRLAVSLGIGGVLL